MHACIHLTNAHTIFTGIATNKIILNLYVFMCT